MRRRTSARIGSLAMLAIAGLVVMAMSASAWGTQGASASRYSTRPGAGTLLGAGAEHGNAVPLGPNVAIAPRTGAQSETTIAVDPTDPLHLLASSNEKLETFTTTNNAYESVDGGRTWVNTNILPGAFCYDTWAGFNRAGDAYLAYECSAGTSGTSQDIAYKLHATATWVKTRFPPSLVGNVPDRDMVAIDKNPASPFVDSVYIGYDDNGSSNKPYVVYSRNGQTGWTRSPKINDTGALTIGVNVAVGPDGTVYASWLDFANKKIMMDKSTDGGATWGTDHIVSTLRLNTTTFFISIPPQNIRGIIPMPFTMVAQSGTHAGRLFEVYTDKSPAAADTNIYLRSSDDGGATWSAEAKVNDDAGGAYQFFPTIAINSAGVVGMSWYDTRNDPTNKKTDVYFAKTRDGVLFTASKKITTAQSDETVGGANGNQYGDYEGIYASPNGKFAIVWTDSRVGSMAEDVYWGPTK